jgi:hypothetical protein
VTLALKSIAMSFPAADHDGHPRASAKGRHFFDDMHSFIAAMAKRFPIQLAVIVGNPAMIATGPLGGNDTIRETLAVDDAGKRFELDPVSATRIATDPVYIDATALTESMVPPLGEARMRGIASHMTNQVSEHHDPAANRCLRSREVRADERVFTLKCDRVLSFDRAHERADLLQGWCAVEEAEVVATVYERNVGHANP